MVLFGAFERLVKPYPEGTNTRPPGGFLPFVWACSQGLRGYIVVMTLLTSAIGVFEALLFAMLEVRPAPFCVLHEVGAALDEARAGVNSGFGTRVMVDRHKDPLERQAALVKRDKAARGPWHEKGHRLRTPG